MLSASTLLRVAAVCCRTGSRCVQACGGQSVRGTSERARYGEPILQQSAQCALLALTLSAERTVAVLCERSELT
jgi:hypothetical protein